MHRDKRGYYLGADPSVDVLIRLIVHCSLRAEVPQSGLGVNELRARCQSLSTSMVSVHGGSLPSWARPVFKCQYKGDPSAHVDLVVLIFYPVAFPFCA